jgi:nucleotide-binding universal stress UspA family protein
VHDNAVLRKEEIMKQEDNVRRPRVVVAGVDFSEASINALKEASLLVEGSKSSELHVVHVLPAALPPPVMAGGVGSELLLVGTIEEATKALEVALAPYRGGDARVIGHVRVGRPDQEIAQVASDVGADLIVVGTAGKRGLERLMLGSVAESLVKHAHCGVLVHRPRAVPAWELIEPPCRDCLAVRQVTGRATLWCERHSERHPRAHTYHEVPEGYGVGSQTFRS